MTISPSSPEQSNDSPSQPSLPTQPTLPAYNSHQLTPLSDADERRLISINHVTYLLYLLSYFTAGLLWIVPIVINYMKRNEAHGSWLATHFDWQIKTFWYSIVWFVIALVLLTVALGGLGVSVFAESGQMAFGSLLMVVLGVAIMGFSVLWHLYRIIRGWIALTDGRAVP